MIKKFFFVAIMFFCAHVFAGNRVLIVYEGKDSPSNPAKGDGLQLFQLLGHFDLQKSIVAADDYRTGESNKFDYLFFAGFSNDCTPPDKFLDDAYNFKGTLVWLGNGIIAMNSHDSLEDKYGFVPERLDSSTGFESVVTTNRNFKFTKGDHYLTIISVSDRNKVEVLANAVAPNHVVSPYAIHSNNLYLFGDSPFSYMGPTDRYLFFAEKLHDILHQEHSESHPALIRIEDVHPLEDPDNIRKISDLLYSEGVPFLIAVVPFYVDPSNNERVSLSDKPDMVDALRYAEAHGATIVMHGDTHQYHGVTASDFEFWDEAGNRPIRDDNAGYVQQKLETGIEELMRNGVYPLAWETPHYGASEIDYAEIAKIFSTTVEQRIVMNDLDYSQFFPYEINQDMYGEKIIPENLGYVPLGTSKEEEQAVQDILTAAKANLYVRDGYATAFIHPFMPLNLLKEIVEGVRDLGYTYIGLKDSSNSVKLPDRAIVSGEASVACSIEDQYLKEASFDDRGERSKLDITPDRITGEVKRNIDLKPGWIYTLEPVEYREKPLSFFDQIVISIRNFWKTLFPEKKVVTPAIAGIVWDSAATGGALHDEESYVTAFRSAGIPVDTLSVNSLAGTKDYNLLIVPYSSAERLSDSLYDAIERFLTNGGKLITDAKNPVAEDLGINFSKNEIRVEKVRDQLFPEELLSWGTSETAHRIDVQENDEVVCTNAINDAPIAVARKYGKGKFISLSARFDPVTDGGYARFPYLVDWLKSYFDLYPVLRRDYVEMYFDPGRHRTTSIETLVKQWASRGIRVIDVAGWHEYPKFMYDYDRLIRLCHAYGIVVNVWIEPPQISQKFYNDHPQWREKNYKGEDVRPDWRYPLALADTACLSAASDWVHNFLASHDWDGVNIAELYFGGDGAPNNPQFLTPFDMSARELFKKKYGFDPVQLFQPSSLHYYRTFPEDWKNFVDFRSSLVTDLTSHFLSLATDAFRNKPGAQIVLTILDQKTFPDLRSTIGVDADQIMQLRKNYSFSLQVEDPQSNWNTDPRRYIAIGNTYRRLLGHDSSDLMIDLNIYSLRDSDYVGIFPSKTPTGTESYLLVNSAAKAAPRMTIYDEAGVLPQDLANFPYAIAPQANMEITKDGYEINAPYSTSIRLSSDVKYILVDGATVFPYQPGYFSIPAGDHVVDIQSAQVNPFANEMLASHIEAASCNVLSERTLQRGVEFTYDSPNRCAVSFGKMPFAVFVDDHETPFTVAREEQHYGIILPSGQHKALVILENAVSYGIDVTSLWSSALIAIFGSFAGGILVVLYAVIKVRRKRAFARV